MYAADLIQAIGYAVIADCTLLAFLIVALNTLASQKPTRS